DGRATSQAAHRSGRREARPSATGPRRAPQRAAKAQAQKCCGSFRSSRSLTDVSSGMTVSTGRAGEIAGRQRLLAALFHTLFRFEPQLLQPTKRLFWLLLRLGLLFLGGLLFGLFRLRRRSVNPQLDVRSPMDHLLAVHRNRDLAEQPLVATHGALGGGLDLDSNLGRVFRDLDRL